MKKVKVYLLTILWVLSNLACSIEHRVEGHASKKGGIEVASLAPDIVIDDFEFREVSLDGVDVEFNAVRAYYYKSVDFLTFEEVQGVLNKEVTPYYFTLPEAMYDRGMKSLISNGRILITAGDVFRLTGFGGVFDFERQEASLDRNVVLQSGSVYVEGEQGILHITDESFRLKKVEATVINLEGFQKELKEVGE